MLLKDWLTATGNRITEGSEYGWTTWPDAYTLDYWDDPNTSSVSVTYNRLTQVVYEATAHDYVNERYYRWLEPQWSRVHLEEYVARGLDPDEAFDGAKYITLSTEEDILEKSAAIADGLEYDDRVIVPLELDDATQLALYREAHRRDLTLNQYVTQVVREFIDQHDQQSPSKDDGWEFS